MRRLLVLLAVVSLLGSAGASAALLAKVPPFPRLPGTWSHAEINVTIRRQPHTLILDRGRIVQASPTQLTLRERDGSVVTNVPVPVAPSTLVTVHGRRASVFDLRRGQTAEAMRIDGGPAVRVKAGAPRR
jgi:hypothetical protein